MRQSRWGLQSKVEMRELAVGKDRNRAIDCLRGVAILAVMLAHGAIPHEALDYLPENMFGNVLRNGYFGVAVFFVISGFLIMSRTIQRYGQPALVSVRDFYVMRVGRILPGLVLSLAVVSLFNLLEAPGFQAPSRAQFFSGVYAALTLQYHVYFLQGGGGPGMNALAIFWSLSIEEVFYIIFPVLCIITLRRGILALALVLVVIAGPLYRVDPTDVFRWWGAAELLAMGCLTALIAERAKVVLAHPYIPGLLKVAGGFALFVAFTCFPREAYYKFGPTGVGVATALFLLGSALRQQAGITRPNVANLPARVLAWIGALSYELYLVHAIVIAAAVGALKFMEPHPFWRTMIVTTTAFVIAALIARYYAEPLNKKIRQFYAKRLPQRL